MKAKVVNVRYIPAECDSHIEHVHNRNDYPHDCLAIGGNGTYRAVYSVPADIEVIAYADAGERRAFRIGAAVRRICNWCKLTEKRAAKIAAVKPSEVDLIAGADGKLEISEPSLQSWLCGLK